VPAAAARIEIARRGFSTFVVAPAPFLPHIASDVISGVPDIEKGGLRVIVYFQHHRQRGPVNALQTRLQG
jgi:hypothetical protein